MGVNLGQDIWRGMGDTRPLPPAGCHRQKDKYRHPWCIWMLSLSAEVTPDVISTRFKLNFGTP